MMKLFNWMSRMTFAPADEGAGGGETLLGADPAAAMFPTEGAAGADTVAGGGETAAAPEWKEYAADATKSDAENAAAKVEHDKTKPAEGVADVVPADGKYDLKMPDGVELDVELANALGPEFAELKLTGAQAQKLVDKYISIQQARSEGHANSPAGVMATVMGEYFKDAGTPDTWMDKAKKDPAIGGTNWPATETNALRFMKHVNDPALSAFLNASGGGNHPALISAFAKAGAMIREDNPASGSAGGAGKPAEAAYVMFPSDAPKG